MLDIILIAVLYIFALIGALTVAGIAFILYLAYTRDINIVIGKQFPKEKQAPDKEAVANGRPQKA